MENDFMYGELKRCKEDEVRPCPFCGSKEIVIDKYKVAAGERFRVICFGCLAMIEMCIRDRLNCSCSVCVKMIP